MRNFYCSVMLFSLLCVSVDSVFAAQKMALLIGCTKYPNLEQEHWLQGPTEDVRLFRELLTEPPYGFPNKNVFALSGWPDDGAARPTRDNIEKAFKTLAAKAAKDDFIVILFSGHGSLQPANADPADLEPDGFDEIFLPADVGEWDEESETVDRAIVDDDVRVWVNAILHKGATVWLMFDSCHSGTMTRDAISGSRTYRQVPMNALIPSHVIKRISKGASFRAAGMGATQGDLSGKGKLVAMYAAQSIEPTFEMPLPTPEDKRHGIFTYTLASVLSQAKTDFTYRELVDRVATLYRCMGVSSPTPMIEGGAADSIVLGGVARQDRPDIAVFVDVLGRRAINRGALHGVSPGSLLEVFPPAGLQDAEKSLGFVKVQRTASLTSIITPVSYNGKAAPPLDAVGLGARCREAVTAFQIPPIKIAVTNAPVIASLAMLRADGGGKGEAVVTRTVKSLAAENPSLLTFASTAADADWTLVIRGSKVELAEGDGTSSDGAWPQQRFAVGTGVRDAALATSMRSVLMRIARARQLMGIASSGSVARRGVDVRVDLVRYASQAELKGEVVGFAGSGRKLRNGEMVAFKITNPCSYPIDVTLLFIDSQYGITSLFPEPGTIDDNRILPEGALVTPRVEVVADTLGPEQVVAIAIRSGVERQDFTCLEQESLGQTRGGTLMKTPLGNLLRSAVYGDSAKRGLKRAEVSDYRMVVLPWTTVP